MQYLPIFSLFAMQDPYIPPLAKAGEQLPRPPIPVPISACYPYSEDETDRIIKSIKIKRFSPNPAGLTEEIMEEIRYFIAWTGLRIHAEIDGLNGQLEWLSGRDMRYPTAAERQYVRQMFPAAQLSESGRTTTLLFVSHIKYELLPEPVKSAIGEIVKMLENGFRKLCEARIYKAMLEDLYDKDDERRQKARDEEASRRQSRIASSIRAKQMAMEIKHAQVTRGFVYVLHSEEIPGLFKVGFTQRNPDERAKEVSHRRYPKAIFRVKRFWRTDDPYIVEQRIFSELSDFRDKGGEFYRCELGFLLDTIERNIASISSGDLDDSDPDPDTDLDIPLSWGI